MNGFMHLKSLLIQGFKSFPDKTVINFNDGITVIVGPNGSGKSNITDAIRWVLGEMSTKLLRGSKMEDVVFDGTQARSAMGFAEVSLVLDNSDGSLPIDFSEVTVTRRFYRSGESEYKINRNIVRLRDIHELFMDTGLGRDGYSMIGQGRIADIISVKSDERRQIFEEAAGISKYRYRRAEAEHKLEQTEENLVRIQDILGELEERVAPLAEQAETAREYLALREEKKGLEVSLWLANIEKIQDGRRQMDADCAAARESLERAEASVGQLEQKIDEIYARSQSYTAEIERIRERSAQLQEQAREREGQITILQNEIEHNDRLAERLREDMRQDDERLQDFDGQIGRQRAQIEENLSQINVLSEEEKALTDGGLSIEAAQGDKRERLESINRRAMELSGEITDLKLQIGYAENSLSVQRQNLSRMEEQAAAEMSALEQLTETDKNMGREGAALDERLQSAENTVNGYRLRMRQTKQRLESETARRAEMERAVAQKTLRLQTLRDMQSHFEGYYGSVKSVMQAAGRGILRGVVGPVSELIRTEDRYSVAVEVALGSQIQNIVVDADDDAKAAIRYLKSNGAGRATFLPVSTIQGRVNEPQTLRGQRGYLGVASGVVECEPRYRSIVEWLLGRVCIVESLDDAVRYAKQTGYKFRMVTLDGQVVNPGGSLTGGSEAKGAGLLRRRGEIERLESELAAESEQFERMSQQLKQIEEKYAADVAYVEGVEAEIRSISEEKTVWSLRRDSLTQQLTQARRNAEQLGSLRAEAAEKIEQLEASLASDRAAQAQLQEKADALQAESEELTRGQEQVAQQLEQLREQTAQLKMRIFTLEKDNEALEQSAAQYEQYKQERVALTQARMEEIENIGKKNEQIRADIERERAAAAELAARAEAEQDSIARLVSEREQAEKDTTAARNEARDAASLKEGLIREAERLESRRESVSQEYDGLVMKLFDEYELTLSEAAAVRVEIESPARAQRRLGEIRTRMKAMGDVNVGAIDEYQAVKQRYEFLLGQTNDLTTAKADIEKVISDLTQRMRTIFSERFKVINERFKAIFVDLFGGGSAEILLSDPNDVLGSPIEIKVTPPGKVIKNLSALSGGEQALVAIALYFAILKVRPTPFCVMDEIDSSLDEVNTGRFAEYLRQLTASTQFIVVTHRRGTMEEADVLYGVTMQDEGISKLLAINVNDVYHKLKIG